MGDDRGLATDIFARIVEREKQGKGAHEISTKPKEEREAAAEGQTEKRKSVHFLPA